MPARFKVLLNEKTAEQPCGKSVKLSIFVSITVARITAVGCSYFIDNAIQILERHIFSRSSE